MSEWGIALIAAGSAVAGSIATDWFALTPGRRQAVAAEHAGNRQADALVATVQATLDEQRRTRTIEQRRHVYLELLSPGSDRQDNLERLEGTRLLSALSMVEFGGPEAVTLAAGAYFRALYFS
ncbi:hypothetical protein ACIA98_35885 [Streptomyces sp. NPDC051366]|uniref:hypothetical protein n=1 Tax=Streptomyces sp. NPDC051366 TaxID=3365652 RepID=UPI00379151BE